MNIKNGLSLVLATILLCACAAQPSQPSPTTQPTSPPAVVEVSQPTAAQPTIEPTLSAPTSTPEPVVLNGTVNAARLNLRTGPSILHAIINQYETGDSLAVIGVAPGKQWVKVIAKGDKVGWMLAEHLTLQGEVSALPVLPISESLIATGKITTAAGEPLAGIQVALTRVGGVEVVRVDGISQADGTIYIYAPVEYQGTWLANVIGVSCTCPIVDTNCRFAGKFAPTEGIPLRLPQQNQIDFIYQ